MEYCVGWRTSEVLQEATTRNTATNRMNRWAKVFILECGLGLPSYSIKRYTPGVAEVLRILVNLPRCFVFSHSRSTLLRKIPMSFLTKRGKQRSLILVAATGVKK